LWTASLQREAQALGITKKSQRPIPGNALERAAWTIPEFCFRNNISQPKYTNLRAEGRGPVEMRLGLNLIRITAEAELNWQRRMQDEGVKFELQAAERAVKAGTAAVKSPKHVSKRGQRSQPLKSKAVRTGTGADPP
jgi:hypothetical protein